MFRFSFIKPKRKHLNFYTYTNLRITKWEDKLGQEICKKKSDEIVKRRGRWRPAACRGEKG